MPEPQAPPKLPLSATRMIREVGSRQERIKRAKERRNDVFSSISLLGVVGWSVTLPTILGVGVGAWIDHHWPSGISWALTLLIAGLVIGCTNAWVRIRKDQR